MKLDELHEIKYDKVSYRFDLGKKKDRVAYEKLYDKLTNEYNYHHSNTEIPRITKDLKEILKIHLRCLGGEKNGPVTFNVCEYFPGKRIETKRSADFTGLSSPALFWREVTVITKRQKKYGYYLEKTSEYFDSVKDLVFCPKCKRVFKKGVDFFDKDCKGTNYTNEVDPLSLVFQPIEGNLVTLTKEQNDLMNESIIKRRHEEVSKVYDYQMAAHNKILDNLKKGRDVRDIYESKYDGYKEYREYLKSELDKLSKLISPTK